MKAQEIIEQTKRLIAIRSTADRPEELHRAVEFVADMIAQTSCDVTIERFERGGKPSFLAYRKGKRPEKFDILLNGHVDVVPAKPEQFEPYEENGKLYGRGALDMKGTTLTLADVFCELVNDAPYSLGLQIVSDEEIGGYDGVRMHIDDYGVRANFVIMGEYANHPHTIYNAARGLCWAEILFKGKSAHGGHLWHGSNAVVKAGAFAGAVLKRYPTPDKETWTTTASISDLSTSNDAFNKVPDKAVLKIDFRFTQEDPVFQNRESLVKFIHELDPEAELVNTATFEPAVHVEELNPYVQGMSRALEAVTGQTPNFLGRPAGSDGRHFALVNNDIVEYGLYGQGSHSGDEYVELASFEEYQATLRKFLRKPIPDKLEVARENKPPREQSLTASGLRRSAASKEPKATIDNTRLSSEYIWYATFGSGLSEKHFNLTITGDKPHKTLRYNAGCTDKTLPLKDTFISLPHRLFFAGNCQVHGGGHAFIDYRRDETAHTISRAYLIKRSQFEEIVAQENLRHETRKLPYKEATQHGHATIGHNGDYDELVYCGMKDDYPVFSITTPDPGQPYAAPAISYINMVCRGLSEANDIEQPKIAHYLMTTPGLSSVRSRDQIRRSIERTR